MKLSPAKTAAKTAKFKRTMARKRRLKKNPDDVSVSLDVIPDRAPARKSKASKPRTAKQTVATELIRIALRLLEDRA